jgi:competence protein ComFC
MHSASNWQLICRKLLDMLFPPTRRTEFVRELRTKQLRSLPQAESPPGDNVFALYRYSNDTVRNIVQATKYDGCRHGARIMGFLLYNHLLEICAETRLISKQVYLVPVPLFKQRKRDRGFNQCRRIIANICKHDSSDTFTLINILEKSKPTKPQATLSKQRRKQNIVGSFSLCNSTQITDKDLIIIDDVTTTGATFTEARKTLNKAKPESVRAVAFAH